MSETVTLPRHIVEQVLDALSTTHKRGRAEQWKLEGLATNALRAALASEPEICNKSCAPGYCYCEELERQQNHGEQVLDMVPAGWRLVPVEPTPEMMLSESSCKHHEWDDTSCSARQTRRSVWATMLAAAPQLPDMGNPVSGTPHVAQETVAWEWQRPVVGKNGETIGYGPLQITRSKKDFLPHWPHTGLYRQPQPPAGQGGANGTKEP